MSVSQDRGAATRLETLSAFLGKATAILHLRRSNRRIVARMRFGPDLGLSASLLLHLKR